MIVAMNCTDGTKRLAAVARVVVGIKGYLAVIKAVSHVGRCEVGDVEGDAARVEYVVAVFAGGHGVTGIEGAAETGAAGVVYEAIDIKASCIWLGVGTVTEGAGEVTEVV
jgi:precorrin-3B methylase